jgi:hypothetical protein
MLRPTVKLHLGPKTRFLSLSDSCGFVHVGAHSLRTRLACRLKLLLALARAVILGLTEMHFILI